MNASKSVVDSAGVYINASYVSKIMQFGLWDIEVKKLIIKPHLVLSTNALISGITQQECAILSNY